MQQVALSLLSTLRSLEVPSHFSLLHLSLEGLTTMGEQPA